MSTIAATPGFGATRTVVRRPARRPATAPGAVRLTRRGRLVFLVAFVAVVFAVLSVLGGHSAATDDSGAPVETRTIVVGEGDTLWGIASAAAEDRDVREMIHQIQELNALSSVALVEGQELAVPVG